jgi:hypothetical protein
MLKAEMFMASLGRFCSKTPCAARRCPGAEQRVLVLSRSDISLKQNMFKILLKLSFDRMTRRDPAVRSIDKPEFPVILLTDRQYLNKFFSDIRLISFLIPES